jgi:cytochrome P450
MHQQANKQWGLSSLRRNYTHPHGIYDALRAHDSIYFDPLSRCWLVTGHTPIVTILSDTRFSSDLGMTTAAPAPTPAASFLHSAVSKQFVFMDGEAHRKAHNVILRPLAQIVKTMPAKLQSLVHALLQTAQQKGALDLVQDFASPVSLQVIAQVLGIPTDDREKLLRLEQCSETFANITSGYLRGNVQDIEWLVDYFRRLIAAKRRAPAEDLLSALIEAQDIFPDEDDLISTCIMVFGAGHTTTRKLLGNGIPVLMQQWNVWQEALREHATLPKLLGEELLRMITPTRYLTRQAREDVDLSPQFPGTHMIAKGEKVLLFLEAGNRDPAVFVEPAHFDPFRRPNKHIAFGFGAHQCPGAMLARAEIQIALEGLLALPGLCPQPGTEPLWNLNPNLGGYTSYRAVIKC